MYQPYAQASGMHACYSHRQRAAQAFAARRDSRVVVVRAAAASVDQTIVIGLAADSGPTLGSRHVMRSHSSTTCHGRRRKHVPKSEALRSLAGSAPGVNGLCIARRVRQVYVHATDDVGVRRLAKAPARRGPDAW